MSSARPGFYQGRKKVPLLLSLEKSVRCGFRYLREGRGPPLPGLRGFVRWRVGAPLEGFRGLPLFFRVADRPFRAKSSASSSPLFDRNKILDVRPPQLENFRQKEPVQG